MKEKRTLHKQHINAYNKKLKQITSSTNEAKEKCKLPDSNTEEINETFKQIVLPKKRKIDELYRPKIKKRKIERDENYIPYASADKHTEEG